jgi:hypothetical protein
MKEKDKNKKKQGKMASLCYNITVMMIIKERIE